MLLIKTKLAPSPHGGIGLFADQFIKKGTMTFRFEPDLDKAYSQEEIDQMSSSAREQFWNYAYHDPALGDKPYVLCFDDGRFINHSDKPNVKSDHVKQVDIAIRDIQPGEELLCDYRHYEPNYFKRRKLDIKKFVS